MCSKRNDNLVKFAPCNVLLLVGQQIIVRSLSFFIHIFLFRQVWPCDSNCLAICRNHWDRCFQAGPSIYDRNVSLFGGVQICSYQPNK